MPGPGRGGDRRGVRELVRRTDDEVSKAVLRVEPAIDGRARRRLRRRRRRTVSTTLRSLGATLRLGDLVHLLLESLVDLPVDLELFDPRLARERIENDVEVVRADPVGVEPIRDAQRDPLTVERVELDGPPTRCGSSPRTDATEERRGRIPKVDALRSRDPFRRIDCKPWVQEPIRSTACPQSGIGSCEVVVGWLWITLVGCSTEPFD